MRNTASLFDEEFWHDPYPSYAESRENAPVRQVVTPDGLRVWLVTRYADVRQGLTDPCLSKDLNAVQHLYERHTIAGATVRRVNPTVAQHMLSTDPPAHTRLRTLVGKAFTAKRVAELQPRIEHISKTLLDAFAGEGEVDIVERYAFPLAITVICELLGLPETDKDRFQAWTRDYNDTGAPEKVTAASHKIAEYVGGLIEDKRRHPADDLMSALIAATDDGDRLTADELVAMAFLLLSAGHETTVNLVSGGMLTLLRHSGSLDRLRAHPDLLPAAVEELLRYDSPVNNATLRFTTAAITVGDVEIPEGEFVLLCLAAGNRDQGAFRAADAFELPRQANAHLSFGHGIHYCLGAPLARREAETALRHWLARYRTIELAWPDEPIRYRRSLLMRGPISLPLRVTGPRAA